MWQDPADRSTSLISGKRYVRNRSYGMNGFIGTEILQNLAVSSPIPKVFTGPEVAALRRTEILTWMDMHEDFIDSCIFYLKDGGAFSVFDPPPPARHYGGAGATFLDGHAEIHHWLNASTVLPVTGSRFQTYPNTGLSVDWIWMWSRSTRLTKGDPIP